MSCTKCGRDHARHPVDAAACEAWQRRLKIYMALVIAAMILIAVGVDLLVNYAMYGDPWCALKTCVEIK